MSQAPFPLTPGILQAGQGGSQKLGLGRVGYDVRTASQAQEADTASASQVCGIVCARQYPNQCGTAGNSKCVNLATDILNWCPPRLARLCRTSIAGMTPRLPALAHRLRAGTGTLTAKRYALSDQVMGDMWLEPRDTPCPESDVP